MTDHVPRVTRADVLRVVQRDYPHGERNRILRTLDGYRSLTTPRDPHRIHLAILKLGAGDTDSLQGWVDLANSDFRDVVTPAEYPRFWEEGFVGVDRMSPQEVEELQRADWEQYEAWLTAR